MKKRIICLALSVVLFLVYIPLSVANPAPNFVAETMTIYNMPEAGIMIFGALEGDASTHPPIRFSATEFWFTQTAQAGETPTEVRFPRPAPDRFTFTDEIYDTATEDRFVLLEIDCSDIFTGSTFIDLQPRAVITESLDVTLGVISGMNPIISYQYSLDFGATWINIQDGRATFDIPGIDISVETEVWIRIRANNATRTPASNPEVLTSAAFEPDEDLEAGRFRFNIRTLTFSNLSVGMIIQASSAAHPQGGFSHTATEEFERWAIPDADYDALFNSEIQIVRLSVSMQGEAPFFERFLTPRHEILDTKSFDLDTWQLAGLNPRTVFQYSPMDYASPGPNPELPFIPPQEMLNEQVWQLYVSNEYGEITLPFGPRHMRYDGFLRVAGTEREETLPDGRDVIFATAPSHPARLEITRYNVQSSQFIKYIEEDNREFLDFTLAQSHFGIDTQFEAGTFRPECCHRESRVTWRRVRPNDHGLVRLASFIPNARDGIRKTYFRVRAARGQELNEPFDFINVVARPALERSGRGNRISFYYHDEFAELRNWSDRMEISERPGRGDSFAWEELEIDFELNIPVLDIPFERERYVIRIAPADIEVNLYLGIYDAITPISRRRSLTLVPPRAAPRITPRFNARTQTRTIPIRRNMELWYSSIVEHENGTTTIETSDVIRAQGSFTLDITDEQRYNRIYIRHGSTGTRPPSEVRILPDTTAPALRLVTRNVREIQDGEIVTVEQRRLTVRRGMEYRVGVPAPELDGTTSINYGEIIRVETGSKILNLDELGENGVPLFPPDAIIQVRFSASNTSPVPSDWQTIRLS